MLKRIAIAVAAIILIPIAVILIIAATRPGTFQIERAERIEAVPEQIFPLISDLRKFSSWSPYETKDPNMQRVFSGPESGKGAAYEWDGDENIGKGRLQIADASAPSKVTMNLEIIRPLECQNIVEFRIEPQGETTNVTWAMHGPMPFISKVMSVFVDMDEMVGSDFEVGLANLKKIAEGANVQPLTEG